MPELHDPPVPLSYAERMADASEATEELARAGFDALNRKIDAYVADTAPHVKRLREIEEAREAARIRADAERLEGRNGIVALLTSKPALIIYSVIVTALATYAADALNFGPTRVQAELSAPDHAEDPR